MASVTKVLPGAPSALEPEPDVAATLCGEHLGVVRAFVDALHRDGDERGLIGPLEHSRLWTRHILNCALVAPLLTEGFSVADVGSGAGLPGLVLAILRPSVSFTLIEPMERRTTWLTEQVFHLELSNVTVLRARAEDRNVGEFDAVTARAVSALRTLIPLTAQLVRLEGELLLMKGASVSQEITVAEKEIRSHRLVDVEVLELGAGVVSDPTRVFRARRA